MERDGHPAVHLPEDTMISTPIPAQPTFMNTGLDLYANLPFKVRDLSPATVRYGRKELDIALVEMPGLADSSRFR
jgi:hypothetical protein